MSVKLGLVTVLFNSESVLPGFFESLAIQECQDYWLFILDNSLNDQSYNAARELIDAHGMKNVTLIKNKENVGVAKGNNQGTELALEMGCEYIVLLNNDIEFESPKLLAEMYSMAQARQEKMVVPKITFFDSGKIWCAGGAIIPWKGTTIHRGEGMDDGSEFSTGMHVNYAPTCFMLIHRSVFEKIGLMDEKYFVYQDDTDFVWRANQAGFSIYYWPDGTVKHKVSSSTGGALSPFATYYCERNRIYFIRKNYRGLQKIAALSFYLLTRPLKYRFFTGRLRKHFFSGVRDGFKM
ncbi:glycosyltransferase family 2 protein [Duganella sp. Leaf126]|uniref:glycosyltransferase family 2 protein n=1 Tax=Duganella sp. Leaf126 TaxID=1736266 RepID=UPI0009E696A3|nr:glycosyltransferase family 2 protein [Duganella sp. Leaf126]